MSLSFSESGIWLGEHWHKSLESQGLPWISLLSMGNLLHPICNQQDWARSGVPKKLVGARGRRESARGFLLLFVSLVHISYKSSPTQQILSPEKMENHRTSWSPRPSPGLAFSYDSYSVDHTTVIQTHDSPNFSLWSLSNFFYCHFGFLSVLPVLQRPPLRGGLIGY